MAEQRLRPLSVGDIFDEGFDLYKKNFALLVLVATVVTVPLDILVAYVSLRLLHGVGGQFAALAAGNWDDNAVLAAFGGIGAAFPIYALLYALPLTALASASAVRYLGETITLRQAYHLPIRRLPALLVTALIAGVALAFGYFVCFIGILVPMVNFLFTPYAFVLEDKSYFGALRRSGGLASASGGRVFGVLLLLLIVYAILALGIEVPLRYAFDTALRVTPVSQGLFGGSTLHVISLRRQIVGQLSTGLANLIISPFLVCVVTVLYFDLRVRKEAFDIELLARGLGYLPQAMSSTLPPPVMPPLAPSRRAGGRAQ